MGGKVKKVVKSVAVEEAIELFNEQVKMLKAHIFVKRTQNTHYNRLKKNLKANEFIIHVDYSENYKDKEQDNGVMFVHHNFGPNLFLHLSPTLIQITLFRGTTTGTTTSAIKEMALWAV